MTNNPVAQILNRLLEQKNCYDQLLNLARQQQEAIESEDDPKLFTVVDQKNPWVQKAHALEKEVADLAENLSDSEREQLTKEGESTHNQVVGALEALIDKETACQQALQTKKVESLDLVKEFKKRKKGLKGYGSF